MAHALSGGSGVIDRAGGSAGRSGARAGRLPSTVASGMQDCELPATLSAEFVLRVSVLSCIFERAANTAMQQNPRSAIETEMLHNRVNTSIDLFR